MPQQGSRRTQHPPVLCTCRSWQQRGDGWWCTRVARPLPPPQGHPTTPAPRLPGCCSPNRLIFDGSHGVSGGTQTSYTGTTELACDVTGTVSMSVTSCRGPGRPFVQGSLSMEVDPACAAASCRFRPRPQ